MRNLHVKVRWIAALGIVGLLVMPSFADTPAEVLLNHLHQNNQKEMHIAKLAVDKGTTPAVKDLGSTLQKDISDAEKKISAIASNQGIKLENTNITLSSDVQKMNFKSGKSFDEGFSRIIIDNNQDSIGKLTAAKTEKVPSEVKSLASSLIPTLQKQIAAAQQITS